MTPTYTDFVTDVLKTASAIARENFGRVTGTTKKDDFNQVLTATDLEIGEVIASLIQQNYPEHNLIDEETGVINNHSRYTWVIDPIDGTSNFAQAIPTYGILVGLLDNDKPIVGGVSLPEFSELYVAEKDTGAFCNNQRLHVTNEGTLINALVAYGIDGHQENPELTKKECDVLAQIILKIRNLRSSNSAYDAMMVAKGSYGAYVNRASKIWDNVANQVIIEEAGGLYTDFEGNSMDYTNPLEKAGQNFTWCAASPVLHQQLQTIIHSKNVI